MTDHAQPQRSAFAETLNDLTEMQESFIYATRRGVLQRAEQLIAQLEKERDEARQQATQAHAAGRREAFEEAEQAQELWQNNRAEFYRRYRHNSFSDWCRAKATADKE